MLRQLSLQQSLLLLASAAAAAATSLVPVPIPVPVPGSTVGAHHLPDVDVAGSQPHAIHIFNSIHSALRQFGSSLHHNGLSFYPVVVPEGEFLYHGTRQTGRPPGLEWLAFEVEHAMIFASSIIPGNFSGHHPPGGGGGGPGGRRPGEHEQLLESWSLHGRVSDAQQPSQQPSRHGTENTGVQEAAAGAQLPLSGGTSGSVLARDDDNYDDDDDRSRRPVFPIAPDKYIRGYLQTYRAARPLNLVYIDGEAAAKCIIGTLDSQDYILLDWPMDEDRNGSPMFGDSPRAEGLCALAREWGGAGVVDGWIRMEAGFEIIYCDFSEGGGLDLVSVHGSPFPNETGMPASRAPGGVGGSPMPSFFDNLQFFEWLRAASERYHGLVRGRADIDFSRMVSAFFYPVNTTNPDTARAELPRILATTRDERHAVRDRLREVVTSTAARTTTTTIQWQGVVDSIVARYSDRIAYLATAAHTATHMRSELATLLHMFFDFPADTAVPSHSYDNAIARCQEHYLAPAVSRQASWTPEDTAIHAAISSVAGFVCRELFGMRGALAHSDGSDAADAGAEAAVRRRAGDLMAALRWTTWKECARCAHVDEICTVPMFPVGAEEDYYAPRCKNMTEMRIGGYWRRSQVMPWTWTWRY